MKIKSAVFICLSVLSFVGCETPPKKVEAPTGPTEQDVQNAIYNAVAKQRAMMVQYVEDHKFGKSLPRLAGAALSEFLGPRFSLSHQRRVEQAVEDEFVRCRKELVFPKWIDWRVERIAQSVRKLAAAAQEDADRGENAKAHAKYEQAREMVWRTVLGAELEGVQIAEVNEGVRTASLALLDSYVNPAHWRIIDHEMRAMALDYSVRGETAAGIEAIRNYPEIRTYTVILDDLLAEVQAELVRLGLKADVVGELSVTARKAMAMAARLADNADVVDSKESKTTLDDGYDPNTEKYRELLRKYHDSLIAYGCTKENADRIVKNFTEGLDEMIRKLRRSPRYGKDFMQQITCLGASAINRRIAALKTELVTMIEKEAASRSELSEQINALLAKGDYEGARRLASEALAKAAQGGEEAAHLRTFIASVVQTKINPAIWESIRKEFEQKMEEFAKGGKSAEGVAWIAAYPKVRTYAEEIDKRYADAVAEAVKLGVPKETAKSLMDEIVVLTAEKENLADYEDRYVHRLIPGKVPDAISREHFYKRLEICRKTLIANGCTPINAIALVNDMRSRFDAEFDRLGEDKNENVLVLGANAINRRLRNLKLRSARELIARCASDAVAAGDYSRARTVIRSVALSGDDEFDTEVYVARVGVLNALVNPFQYLALSNEVVRTFEKFCADGDYKGLKKWATEYPGVHDDYSEIEKAISMLKDAAKGLGAESTTAEEYAEKLEMRTDRLLEQRSESYERPTEKLDMRRLDQALEIFEQSLLVQHFRRDIVRNIRDGIRKEITALPGREQPPPMTTWEMNERLNRFRLGILLGIAQLEEMIADQEYREYLASLDREFSYDSQIAMAEGAISRQVAATNGASPLGVTAVLGEYARVMRLLKLNHKLTAGQLTAMVLGSVLLDQVDVFKRALELGADVNGVSPRDPFGRTALLLALQLGRTAFVGRLVEADAFVKVADAGGSTALHYAVRNGNLGMIKAMLEKNDINATNAVGETALMDAAKLNRRAVVDTLLAWRGGEEKKLKADVEIRNSEGLSAFSIACVAGSLDVLDSLAKAGSKYGSEQLAAAADRNLLGVAQWLVTHGVDVNGPGVMSAAVCGTEVRGYLISEGGVAICPCNCRTCQAAREKAKCEAEAAAKANQPLVVNVNVSKPEK